MYNDLLHDNIEHLKTEQVLIILFEKAWTEDKRKCIRTLVNKRFYGLKTQIYSILYHIKLNMHNEYPKILSLIIKVGNWGDVIYMCELSNTCYKNIEVELNMMKTRLLNDITAYSNDLNVSEFSTYAPLEGHLFDAFIETMDMTPKRYTRIINRLRNLQIKQRSIEDDKLINE